MNFIDSDSFASTMDADDPLAYLRGSFNYPSEHRGQPCTYFCGNSLGLQPKATSGHIGKELDRWHRIGVEGWFDEKDPWLTYQDTLSGPMSKIVGAKPQEVVIMNSLTVNLHLLMASFYRPGGKRYRILMESDAFPSDRYALQAQVSAHGHDPSDAIIILSPDEGPCISTGQVLRTIREHNDELALVLLGGVNYYTGQLFDIEKITAEAHAVGAIAGWDLAHAAGNVPLRLHDHQVDFAAWCNYKYLNSGPGSVASAFIHEKHHSPDVPRLSGWWGQSLGSRFNMRKEWDPAPGASGWMVSTPPILALACVRSSLELFEKAGMDRIRAKSLLLTGYLEFLLTTSGNSRFEIITPTDTTRRGSQLSIRVRGADKSLLEKLNDRGIIVDWREPDVIRVAPAPLYNTFTEVRNFVIELRKLT